MTLEEYYKKIEQIQVPEGLDLYDRVSYRRTIIEELQKELSPEDLEEIKKRERRWADKMQSSVG